MGFGNLARHNRALLTQSDTIGQRTTRRPATAQASSTPKRRIVQSESVEADRVPLNRRPDRGIMEFIITKYAGRLLRKPDEASRAAPHSGRRGRPDGRRVDGREDDRLRITFHGAAKQVTGSAHLLEIGGSSHPARLRPVRLRPDGPEQPEPPVHVRAPRPRRGDRLARPQRPHRPPPLPDPGRLQRPDPDHPRHGRHPQRHAPRQRANPARGCAQQQPGQRPGRPGRAPVRPGRRRVGRRAAPAHPLRRGPRDPSPA